MFNPQIYKISRKINLYRCLPLPSVAFSCRFLFFPLLSLFVAFSCRCLLFPLPFLSDVSAGRCLFLLLPLRADAFLVMILPENFTRKFQNPVKIALIRLSSECFA
jgi:hypothetical protein